LAGCLTALLFLMPEYFQLARNLSGSRSGLLLLGVTLSAVMAFALSDWLGRRLSTAARGVVGVGCLAVGLAVLVTLGAHSRWAVVIGALGLMGLGLGVAAATARALPGVAATLDAAALAGACLGLAAAGGAFQFAQADERESGATFQEALATGVGWAALFLIVGLAGAALVIWRQGRRATPASSEAHPAAGS
jgi:MFS family permease